MSEIFKTSELIFDIQFTTASPLCQMQGLEERMINGSKQNIAAIQKLPVFVDYGNEKKVVKLPIYTANGFRGLLRRVATSIVYSKAIEKGISLGNNGISIGKSFHASNAGSNVSYTNLTIPDVEEVRELSPVISLLGTSLAVSGKIDVTSLKPKRFNEETQTLEYCYRTTENGKVYSDVVDLHTSYKKDDILSETKFTSYLGRDFAKEWEKLVEEAKADSKAENLGASHVVTSESISEGVDFYGSIVPSAPLTDIEKGLLLRSMIEITKHKLGATNSKGMGMVNYSIKINDRGNNDYDGIIRSTWNDYGSRTNTTFEFNEELQGYVSKFDAWLEEISEDNIQIEKVLGKFQTK